MAELFKQRLHTLPFVEMPNSERIGADCPDVDFMTKCHKAERVAKLRYNVPSLATSYDIQYTERPTPDWSTYKAGVDDEMVWHFTLTWYMEGSGGSTIRWQSNSLQRGPELWINGGGYVMYGPWFAEKMGINGADADGLLLFLEQMGHTVSFCCDVRAVKMECDIAFLNHGKEGQKREPFPMSCSSRESLVAYLEGRGLMNLEDEDYKAVRRHAEIQWHMEVMERLLCDSANRKIEKAGVNDAKDLGEALERAEAADKAGHSDIGDHWREMADALRPDFGTTEAE